MFSHIPGTLLLVQEWMHPPSSSCVCCSSCSRKSTPSCSRKTSPFPSSLFGDQENIVIFFVFFFPCLRFRLFSCFLDELPFAKLWHAFAHLKWWEWEIIVPFETWSVPVWMNRKWAHAWKILGRILNRWPCCPLFRAITYEPMTFRCSRWLIWTVVGWIKHQFQSHGWDWWFVPLRNSLALRQMAAAPSYMRVALCHVGHASTWSAREHFVSFLFNLYPTWHIIVIFV